MLTSNGWSACVLCDDKQNRITPQAFAGLINFKLILDTWAIHEEDHWPGFSRMLGTAGKNRFLNHSRKYGHSIHPDSDTLKYAPDDPPPPQILHFVYDIG